jgi:uncharacterized protein
MPAVTYPGVYIQEIPGGARPIEIASTSTAAFVGLTERGPDEATLVTSWTEYQRIFGGFIADGYLPHSVFHAFNNGLRQCYIVRVTRSDAAVAIASVTVNNRADPSVRGLTFSAKNKGAWGNSLVLTIDDGTLDPGNEFRISVRRQVDPNVMPENLRDITPLEVFDNLSVDAGAPNFVVNALKQGSTLINAQLHGDNTSLQHGLHRGGLGPNLPLRENLSFQISLDNEGFQVVTLPPTAGGTTTLTEVATAIQTAVQALTKKKNSTKAEAFERFTADVEAENGKSRLVLRSGTILATSSVRIKAAANDATAQLKLGLGNGGLSEDGVAVRRPVSAPAVQVGDAEVSAQVAGVVPGSDGKEQLTEQSFSGAFKRLDNVTDFSLLAVPGESTPTMAAEGMGYCANRPLQDVFYLAETAFDNDTIDEAKEFRAGITTANSYGALYFPWVKSLDPSGQSPEPILLPPSGYIAGLYARIDSSRGVWKAPAGTEASLNGAVGLAAELSDVQHGNLNPLAINVIRRFPTAGIVSFGARTISSNPEWKYVSVRRTAIMLRVSIYYGIQWAVFEPNDEPLWSELRLNIGSFMTTLFRQGAFQGSTPTQAFFVKCDAETTTQADIDLGIVNVLVGFAPLKPAEFVVVKISQQAGQV